MHIFELFVAGWLLVSAEAAIDKDEIKALLEGLGHKPAQRDIEDAEKEINQTEGELNFTDFQAWYVEWRGRGIGGGGRREGWDRLDGRQPGPVVSRQRLLSRLFVLPPIPALTPTHAPHTQTKGTRSHSSGWRRNTPLRRRPMLKSRY